MALLTWNAVKNAKFQHERGVSFEELVAALDAGDLLANLPHRISSGILTNGFWL